MISPSTGSNNTSDFSKNFSVDKFIVLDERVNRYQDGYVVGYLQAATGLQPKSPYPVTQTLSKENLRNKNPETIIVNPVTKASCVVARIPRHIRRQFKTKFIDPGTVFNCNLVNNREIIITGIFEDPNGSVILDNKMNEPNL